MNEVGERRPLATVIRINAHRVAREELTAIRLGAVQVFGVNIGGLFGLDPKTEVCLLCVEPFRTGTDARIWHSRRDGKKRIAHARCLDEAVR